VAMSLGNMTLDIGDALTDSGAGMLEYAAELLVLATDLYEKAGVLAELLEENGRSYPALSYSVYTGEIPSWARYANIIDGIRTAIEVLGDELSEYREYKESDIPKQELELIRKTGDVQQALDAMNEFTAS